jgi:hypothetical protein
MRVGCEQGYAVAAAPGRMLSCRSHGTLEAWLQAVLNLCGDSFKIPWRFPRRGDCWQSSTPEGMSQFVKSPSGNYERIANWVSRTAPGSGANGSDLGLDVPPSLLGVADQVIEYGLRLAAVMGKRIEMLMHFLSASAGSAACDPGVRVVLSSSSRWPTRRVTDRVIRRTARRRHSRMWAARGRGSRRISAGDWRGPQCIIPAANS